MESQKEKEQTERNERRSLEERIESLVQCNTCLQQELGALRAVDLNKKEVEQLQLINVEQERQNANKKHELQRIKIMYYQEKENKEDAERRKEYLSKRVQKIEGSQQEY